MDARTNPYAPGAGNPPPELAGRDALIERASVALDRIRAGKPARSFVFYGLRGVGKTVLLNTIRRDAERKGFLAARIEAPEDRSLPAILIPALRTTLLKLDRAAAARDVAGRALRTLYSFARGMKIKFQDVELGLSGDVEPGSADSGDLEADLTALLEGVGDAAAAQGNAVAIFIDELQYVPEEQLAALISALHILSQNRSPIAVMAAGLPQLVGQTGRAKSYAERLFEFVPVDRLDDEAARAALCKPAERENVAFTDDAVKAILKETRGYPYFLQEWGKHSWDNADASPIDVTAAEEATFDALAELDASFFRVRFDRLTPAEKRYIRAMADLGPGPHRSGDIAERLGRKVTTVAPTRSSLIHKGMI